MQIIYTYIINIGATTHVVTPNIWNIVITPPRRHPCQDHTMDMRSPLEAPRMVCLEQYRYLDHLPLDHKHSDMLYKRTFS